MRHVIDCAADGTNAPARSVRVVRYPVGWDVRLGIGDPGADRPARATAVLSPDQALELAAALQRAAADAAAVRAADAA